MNSFELFEMTMEKINKHQARNLKKTLDVETIKEELRKNGLPGACKMLHEFISKELDDECFKKTFSITYGFDNGKREKILGKSNQRKISASTFEDKMGYFVCFSDEGKKTKTCCSLCDANGKYRCDKNEYVYGSSDRVVSDFTGENAKERTEYEQLGKKAELDHFLTRLLFEAASKKTTLGHRVNETGLFILAAEVMGEEAIANNLKEGVEKGNKEKEIKENIRTIIEETNYTRDNE